MQKKVSIIIPAFNCADCIELTVKSILDLNYPLTDLEIIIINDGSTDDTAKVIDQWVFHRQFIIRHTLNQGASASRELGRNLASGDFIQYLDSDDLLLANKLQLQIESLKANGADIAYCNWQRFRESDGQIFILKEEYPLLGDDAVLDSFNGFWCPPAAFLFTKAIVDKIGPWPDDLPIIQDARYLQNAAMEGARFVKTEATLAQYRISETSLSMWHGELKFYQDVYHNTLNIWEIWKKTYPERTNYKQAILESLRNCAKIFIQHDRVLFDQCIAALLNIEPNYIPDQSRGMHWLSRLIGFKPAVILAYQAKRIMFKTFAS